MVIAAGEAPWGRGSDEGGSEAGCVGDGEAVGAAGVGECEAPRDEGLFLEVMPDVPEERLLEVPEPDFLEEPEGFDEELFLEEFVPEDFFLEEPEDDVEDEFFFLVEDDDEAARLFLRKSSFFCASVNSARNGASKTPADRRSVRRDNAP